MPEAYFIYLLKVSIIGASTLNKYLSVICWTYRNQHLTITESTHHTFLSKAARHLVPYNIKYAVTCEVIFETTKTSVAKRPVSFSITVNMFIGTNTELAVIFRLWIRLQRSSRMFYESKPTVLDPYINVFIHRQRPVWLLAIITCLKISHSYADSDDDNFTRLGRRRVMLTSL